MVFPEPKNITLSDLIIKYKKLREKAKIDNYQEWIEYTCLLNCLQELKERRKVDNTEYIFF